MANHACVAIGINRYQFLQPLSYGQADAQALRHFLVRQASLPSNQCLVLTDTSPLVDNQSTYPSRENILNWLRANHQNSRQSENWRWFFFSGYGVNWQNADYLMPIDGNPDDIPVPGISSGFPSIGK
ncbi:MAG: peptidase C14, partial [Microcoleus sp. SIO2G3]|nr:peptidase C14 [Microcoleus sp. SIO2G3]